VKYGTKARRYFVIEMFPEFRAFFKFVLHAQVLLFSVPIAIRFRHRPLFAFLSQALVLAIFKPHPVLADVSLYLSLLPLLLHTLKFAQGCFFLGWCMLFVAVLEPVTHYQWLHTASANANFYYAVTVAWSVSEILLLMLLTSAVLKFDRELQGKPLVFKLDSCRHAASIGCKRSKRVSGGTEQGGTAT
jgi:GPI-anchor transamidase subunit U